MQQGARDRAARLYVLAAAVLFSTGGAAIKLSSLSSWQIAGFRSGLAASLLFVALPTWRRIDRASFLVGLAYAASLILYVTANTLTTAANAIFLQTTAPLYVLVLGPVLLGEANRRQDLLVVALMAIGLVLFLLSSERPLATAPDPALGNTVAAVSGVAWALTLIGLRWLSGRPTEAGRDASGAAVVAGNTTAFLCCLPFALPLQTPTPSVDFVVVIYLGVFQIGLAYVCLVRGIQRVRAIEVSLLLVLEPVLNAFWAWLVHDEAPGVLSAVACGFVLAGLIAQALLNRAPIEA